MSPEMAADLVAATRLSSHRQAADFSSPTAFLKSDNYPSEITSAVLKATGG
jgi:hypothetical protein